jgi:hypothetical protein
VPDKVHLTKQGIQVLTWDDGAEQFVEKQVSSVLFVLRCDCYIDSGVTLGDIFRAVEAHRDLVLLLRAWSHCDVDAFHAEARKPAVEPWADLHYIEVSRQFDWSEDGAYNWLRVRGVGEPGEFGSTHYGIDMTPVNQIAHLPVRLKPHMEISRDSTKIAEAQCGFTLLDVLGEIYWEISFFGNPASRDDQVAEFEETVREIEEGRAELIPLRLPKDKVQ